MPTVAGRELLERFLFQHDLATELTDAERDEYLSFRLTLNEAEAEVCRQIILALLRKNVHPDSLAIIVFYKEQSRLLGHFAKRTQVNPHGFDAERGEFLNDPHRLNVALSRCRHGQFVLGHEKSLVGLSYWDILLRWAVTTTAIAYRSARITGCFFSLDVHYGLRQPIEASSPHRDLAAVQLVRSTPRPRRSPPRSSPHGSSSLPRSGSHLILDNQCDLLHCTNKVY
ncbi:hypothetical protein COOONC_09435 [Cooperia oncophora]